MGIGITKRVILVGGFLIIFSFCACSEYNDGYSDSGSVSDNKTYSNESIYEKQLTNNISVAAKVKLPKVDKNPIILAERQGFDNNKVKEIFFKDEKSQSKINVESVMGENIEYTTSETESGKLLTVGKGIIEYNMSQKAYVNNIFSLTDIRIWTKDSVDFMNKNDAIKKAIDLSKSLGIEVNDIPLKVIAIDFENLKKSEEELKNNKKYDERKGKDKIKAKTLSKEDEAYYIELIPVYNGINLISKGISLQTVDKFLEGGKISVLIDKNGIYQFVIGGTVYKQTSIIEENPKILTLDEALEKVKDTYKDILTSDKIKIVEIRLAYAPDKEQEKFLETKLIPTWCFLAEVEGKSEKTGENEVGVNEIYINAATGNVIR